MIAGNKEEISDYFKKINRQGLSRYHVEQMGIYLDIFKDDLEIYKLFSKIKDIFQARADEKIEMPDFKGSPYGCIEKDF